MTKRSDVRFLFSFLRSLSSRLGAPAVDRRGVRRAAALSPPFILCNSIVGLLGVLIAGQKVASGTPLYSVAAVVGAGVGAAINFRWMSERATRYVLVLILLFAGLRMIAG